MLVVARTPTPFAQVVFPKLIEDAFQAENVPLRGLQRMMLAVLVSLETGRGGSMKNNNIGNITAGPNYQGAIWRPPWFDPAEVAASGNPKLAALHQEMLRGHAPNAFRSYDGIIDGARDFARVVSKNFPEVLRAALTPNAETFRAALAQKYSPDYRNPAVTKSIAQLMKEFSIVPDVTLASTGSGLLVALALAWLAWKYWR